MCGALVVASKERDDSGVDFDAGNDSPLLQQFGERGTVIGFLIEGLVEQDDPRDVVADGGARGEQQLSKKIIFSKYTGYRVQKKTGNYRLDAILVGLPVLASVLVGVLETDVG